MIEWITYIILYSNLWIFSLFVVAGDLILGIFWSVIILLIADMANRLRGKNDDN